MGLFLWAREVSLHRHVFVEPSGVGADLVFKVEERLASVRSQFQHIEVWRSKFFGKILAIDGDLMLTEHDESSYHEMIAYTPLVYRPKAVAVLVVGGGDGGTVGQVLRHENVRNVTVVEIDEAVPRVCHKHFSWLAASLNNSRVTLHLRDGAVWAAEEAIHHPGQFDVAIVDSTDFGAAAPLSRASFQRNLHRLLKLGGLLVINLTSLSWNLELVRTTVRRQRRVFKYVRVFQIFQPTYTSGHYCFMLCSDTTDPATMPPPWAAFERRGLAMKYFSPSVHKAAFALPEFARRMVDEEGKKDEGEQTKEKTSNTQRALQGSEQAARAIPNDEL